MKKMLSVSRSDFLLVAATVVAALRLMLINAVFINFDLKQWPWFAEAEVWSGLAFAVLEGLALAYISKRWRKLNPKTYTDWVYWSILLIGQLILLASIIWVTAYAAAAVRRGQAIDELLGDTAAIVWSSFVTAINPILVMLIGIVEDDERGQKGEASKSEVYAKLPEFSQSATDRPQKPFAHLVRKAQAGGILDQWEQEHGKTTPTVLWLSQEFNRVIGEALPAHEADEAIVEWRRRHGIAGRRPKEEAVEVEGQVEFSQNGAGEK